MSMAKKLTNIRFVDEVALLNENPPKNGKSLKQSELGKSES